MFLKMRLVNGLPLRKMINVFLFPNNYCTTLTFNKTAPSATQQCNETIDILRLKSPDRAIHERGDRNWPPRYGD